MVLLKPPHLLVVGLRECVECVLIKKFIEFIEKLLLINLINLINKFDIFYYNSKKMKSIKMMCFTSVLTTNCLKYCIRDTNTVKN
jgi:hypothetical protein